MKPRLRANRIVRGLAITFALAATVADAGGPHLSQQRAGTVPVRIHPQPKLKAGDKLRYLVQFQTINQTKRTGTVSDPQGPSQTVVTWDAALLVEVLPPATAATAPAAEPGKIRIRTTYEKSVAKLESDTPDPEQESVEKQYAQMQGRSIEFALDSAGHVSDVKGLEGIVSDKEALAAAQRWMAQFSTGLGVPAAGIAPGDKWTTEEPAASLPLAGYVWRTDSTYLRNEPCRPASLSATPQSYASETCAVILAQLSMNDPRSKKNLTPDEFRQNGLTTSGTWSGTGESLTYISLTNGWAVSVTQQMAEQVDVTITTVADRNGVRYSGSVDTRSSLSLAPPEAAAAP